MAQFLHEVTLFQRIKELETVRKRRSSVDRNPWVFMVVLTEASHHGTGRRS
jgi:hypothetical protein